MDRHGICDLIDEPEGVGISLFLAFPDCTNRYLTMEGHICSIWMVRDIKSSEIPRHVVIDISSNQ